MIVLHALWEQGDEARLHLWAESSRAPAGASRRGRRSGATTRVAGHPFALETELLRETLGELGGSLLAREAVPGVLTLRLPSTTRGPLASPELVREEEPDLSAPALAAWEVPALALDAGAALDLLLALPVAAPFGQAFGSSLRFWVIAARLSYELLSRQCYAPTLREANEDEPVSLRAGWEPVLSSEDALRVNKLARLMPPVCWSLVPADQPLPLPDTLLMNFLDRTIDAFVRASLLFREIAPAPGKRGNKPVPLPEQWLRALASPDPYLEARPDELEAFADVMSGWLELLHLGEHDAAFRTCFRLDPPAEQDDENQVNAENQESETAPKSKGKQKNGAGNEREESKEPAPWRMSFYLQANDDRSLLVPAENVWQERSSTLTFLKRTFENPQERLLADLGRAARLFPAIEESLKRAHPDGLLLDTTQAYTFLREAAPLLEQSGFGVLIPPWWRKPAARLGVKLKIRPKASPQITSGLLGMQGIVAYDWSISIGNMTLTAEEFEKLVQLKQPLIQVRGQWVELHSSEIERAIAFFQKKRRAGSMTLGEALRTGLGQGQSELGLPVTAIESEGWITDLLAQLSDNNTISSIPAPTAFQGQLRPYQLRGVSWLAFLQRFGFGACLADDMGLGKCILGNTMILVNGNMESAESIWTRCAGDITFDSEGYWASPTRQLLTNAIDETTGRMVQAPIKRLYRQHVSERLRVVQLEDGTSVTITHAHKLLTDKGWTNDFRVGDYVCVPAKLLWDGKPEDPDLVKFLAWQISEGYEAKGQNGVNITQKDASILEGLRLCLLRLSSKYAIKINSPSVLPDGKRCFYLRVTSVAYRRFLEEKGYIWGNLSREKRIPDFIMRADLESIRVFLQNYFEAEASVVESMKSIEISTASPLLIQQLSVLLRRFGIWLRVSVKQKRATNGSGISRSYQIGVLGGNAARTFCREIGFVSERKQQKLERICERVNNSNVEGIPASTFMAQIVATTGLPIRHFGMGTVYVAGSQQFSPASLKGVVAAMDDILSGEAERLYREKPVSKWTAKTLAAYAQLDRQYMLTAKKHLQHLLGQEVYYCRIKSIEKIHHDGWVYDFEVEQHHNFVANTILCHNTIQMITLLLHERKEREGNTQAGQALLICPMSIVGNWQREIQRFAPSLKVMIHHGHERLSGEAFVEEARRHDVVITTYALALRDREHLAGLEWEYVVVDEAQNIKNESARQTQAIKSLSTRHRVALTGTPVENRLSELWSIMEFLNPGYLGSATDFRQRFTVPIERYHDQERADLLKRVIQPFVLRRVKTDKSIIADLPEKQEIKVYCNLTQEQASLYEAVVKEMIEKIENAEEDIERRGLILATLMKLKQVCNHPAQFVADSSKLPGRSGKLARLEEMLEEVLATGEKALIFSQFAEMGTLLRRHLQETFGSEVFFLHGGVPKKQRDSMVQRFQEDRRGPQIFILSLKAGGVGLNLTAANHVFHFDRWWNPAVENQATDRAFRIGQTKNVQVHKFVCVGTLEERIDQMIEQKKALAENIVGSGENWLTEMSTTQLKELFALSREAVGE